MIILSNKYKEGDLVWLVFGMRIKGTYPGVVSSSLYTADEFVEVDYIRQDGHKDHSGMWPHNVYPRDPAFGGKDKPTSVWRCDKPGEY